MNSLSPDQKPLSWWVEVYTSNGPQPHNLGPFTYNLGPFNSREKAKISRGAHVEALCHQNVRDIVALIKAY